MGKIRIEEPSNSIKFRDAIQKAEFLNSEDYDVDLSDAASELEELVNSTCQEQLVHEFLEQHPHFLPGFSNYHLGPAERAIVSKLPLGHDYVTDFAFLAYNSMEVCLTVIEIESPSRCVFTKAGDFSQEYNHAKQQLVDWLAWSEEHRKEAFDCFGKLGRTYLNSNLRKLIRAFLIIGNSKYFDTEKMEQRWSGESRFQETRLNILSYNRLVEFAKAAHIFYAKRLLLCVYKDRNLHVKWICGKKRL